MKNSRRPIVAGNWKMNLTLSEGVDLAVQVNEAVLRERMNVQVILFPSFPLLRNVGDVVRPNPMLGMGAQALSQHDSGAYTGEVSGEILKSVGTSHVLIGHSERRRMFGEQGEVIRGKVLAALRAGLRPLLCVGETEQDRSAGMASEVVTAQLEEGLHPDDGFDWDHLVIAYEPVWAIGTGRNASPDDAEEMHALIRKWISDRFGTGPAAELRILYGGSLSPENARAIFQREGVDGGLVGGASLRFDSFHEIIEGAAGI